MSFIKEILAYLISQKKFWLIPLMVVFALLGMLFILGQGSVIAPFIYTLF